MVDKFGYEGTRHKSGPKSKSRTSETRQEDSRKKAKKVHFEEDPQHSGKYERYGKAAVQKIELTSEIIGGSEVWATTGEVPLIPIPPAQNHLMQHFLKSVSCLPTDWGGGAFIPEELSSSEESEENNGEES
jgi:hypothetical protein